MNSKRCRAFLAATLLLACPPVFSAGLVPVQVNDEVSYVSGGIGLDESTAIKQMRADYPLTMVFAETTSYGRNQYLAAVQVEIYRGSELVFETLTEGPYLLVQLPAGNYRVMAIHNGVPRVQAISVGSRPKQVGWTWQAPPDDQDPYLQRGE